MERFDTWAFFTAVALLAARHLWVLLRSEESRGSAAMRRQWVERVMRGPGYEILAVQTLRTSIMAATVMASTSAIGLMGAISIGHLGATGGSGIGTLGALGIGQLKLVLPVLLLAVSLVLFSAAVRLYHRCSYLLGLGRVNPEAQSAAEPLAVEELERASGLYRHGWRVFYGAIATAAWLLSGWLALLVTITLLGIDLLAHAG